MTTEAAPQLLTRHEAAQGLRVSLATLERLIARGDLPSVKVGRRRFVRSTDLDAYIASLGAKAAS
ncbi:MAG: helix-turn-helix domain-containing protein [Actinomycetota bacterium]|nr:helix-turn-helix domain-containing protein [Actinomycetota bacterium]